MKIISLLLFSLALACAGGGNGNSDNTYPGEDYALDEAVYDGVEAKIAAAPVNEPQEITVESKIIKTANLRFESNEPEKTRQELLALTQKYNGFIQSDNAEKRYNQLVTYLVVKVPTENFNTLIEEISKGVTYFDQKDISRKDVTEEFVDLEARLKTKKELENRYLSLLKETKNIKEILEIEKELSQIREEIEAKEGRLKYLSSQVAFSTIYVEFYKQTSETGVTLSYGKKMLNAIKGGWDGISMFFIGLLYLWPLFVLAIITILLLRYFLKKKKNKTE